MNKLKLSILSVLLGSMTLAISQLKDTINVNAPQQRQEIAGFAELGAKSVEQGEKFAAAADYLRMVLVLGLGIIIGRMGSVSHRELAELKGNLARLVNRSSAKEMEIRET